MAQTLKTYLYNHSKKEYKGEFVSTHTRIPDKDLNIYAGNFCIPDKEEFWKLYYDYIEGGGDEYLTECQDKNGVIAIDLDFRYNHDIKTRQHNAEHREWILMAVTETLKDFYEFKNDDSFDVFVFEKPNVNRLADGSLTKDGIHIIIGLTMFSENRKAYREKIIQTLADSISDLPLINSWDCVVDDGVLSGKENSDNLTNWCLYGSKKPDHEAYQLIQYWNYKYDASDKNYCQNACDTTMTFELFKKLSVQNLERPEIEQLIVLPKNKKKSNSRRPSPVSITEVVGFESADVPTKEDDIYYKYLNCIGNKMCDRTMYNECYTICQALKNENLDKKYVTYWIHKYAYPQSKKYVYAIENYDGLLYTPLSDKKRASVKTLKFHAKRCNPKLYSEYFKDDYEFRIKKDYWINADEKNFLGLYRLLDEVQSEKGLKDLYIKYKKERVHYKKDSEDDKNPTIYLYYNDEWNAMTEKGRMIKNDMEEFFVIVFKVLLDLINEFKKAYLDDAEKVDEIKRIDKVWFETKRGTLKVVAINQIFQGLLNNLSAIKSNIEFDIGKENHYNIHFKNGVYDMKAKKFRSRVETDYVTKFLDYDYMPLTDISDEIQSEVLDFFTKIQPNEEQRKFTLSYLAYCITGNTGEQVFKMNIGHSASNGKSTELTIHEKCFPIYTEKMDNRVLLLNFEKRHKYLVSLVKKPIRLVYFEEMPKGKKLDVEFVKDFVDGRGIDCEIMFGTKDKIKNQAKLMSASNHDFNCDTDAGIIRRGRVQKYNSRFVDEEEYHLLSDENHIYKKVKGYEDMYDDVRYKNAYFHLLLQYVDKLYIPQENKDEFKKTAEDSDLVLNHILDTFILTGNSNDILSREEICISLGINKDKFADYKDKLQGKGCKWDSQKKAKYEGKWYSGIFTGIRNMTEEEKMSDL